MNDAREPDRPISVSGLMKLYRQRGDAAAEKLKSIPVDASEVEQRTWHYYNGMAAALHELECHLRLYLDTFPIPPQFETPNPGEVNITLGNGAKVSLREDENCLHVGQIDEVGEDWWICTISADGTLGAPNCAEACDHLTRGLKKTTET